MTNEERFVGRIMLLSGVSKTYAVAAWYTLSSAEQKAKTPELGASTYASRFLSRQRP